MPLTMHYERGLTLRKAATDAVAAHAETYCTHDSEDRIALVNLFCGLARKRNGFHGYADEQVLEKFFVKGAVSLTVIRSRADHPGVDALQFKVLKREATVINKALLKYSQAFTAPADRVCVSATYPIQSRREQTLFVAALKHNSLDDFLAPGVSLHFTTVTRITNTPTPPQFGPQDHAPTSPPYSPLFEDEEGGGNAAGSLAAAAAEAAAAEAAPDEAAPDEERNEPAPTEAAEVVAALAAAAEAVAAEIGEAAVGNEAELEPVSSSSESENEEDNDTFEAQWASIQDAQVGAARHGQRVALRHFADELFEHRESMTDETFRKLNNALKRRHDEL